MTDELKTPDTESLYAQASKTFLREVNSPRAAPAKTAPDRVTVGQLYKALAELDAALTARLNEQSASDLPPRRPIGPRR